MNIVQADRTFSHFDAAMIVEGQWELAGEEPDEEVYFAAAQHLIDTGLAWSLQGFFGRTCNHLIREGYCRPAPEEVA